MNNTLLTNYSLHFNIIIALSLRRYLCLIIPVRNSFPAMPPSSKITPHTPLPLPFIYFNLFILVFFCSRSARHSPRACFLTMSILFSKHFHKCVIHQSLYWRRNPRSWQKRNCALPSPALWRKISGQSIRKGTNQTSLIRVYRLFQGEPDMFSENLP